MSHFPNLPPTTRTLLDSKPYDAALAMQATNSEPYKKRVNPRECWRTLQTFSGLGGLLPQLWFFLVEGVEWIPTMICMYSADMPESTPQICPSQLSTLRFLAVGYSGLFEVFTVVPEIWRLKVWKHGCYAPSRLLRERSRRRGYSSQLQGCEWLSAGDAFSLAMCLALV